MSQEFSDEMLSAYLDGELSPTDVGLVESRLKADAGARALLVELKSIRTAFADLPSYTLEQESSSNTFSQRVMARIRTEEATSTAPVKAPATGWSVSLKAVLALAACTVLVGVLGVSSGWFNRTGTISQPIASSGQPSTKIDSGNSGAAVTPAETATESPLNATSQTLIVRISLTKEELIGQALDKALAEQGIAPRSSDGSNPLANELMARARKHELGGSADPAVAATPANVGDVVLVEATHEQVSNLLKQLAAKAPLHQDKMALHRVQVSETGLDKAIVAESESGGKVEGKVIAGAAYAQHLNPRLFSASGATSAASELVGADKIEKAFPNGEAAQKPCRVLVVVELAP